mmetsp:Transcript_26673/g.63263  ORF Transcript_26673/g.63263 Transcript_26673/m.63263 type:complete len:122 (-) Transcript_26673:71-436(-)
MRSFCRLGSTSQMSLAKRCFLLHPERAGALEVEAECLSALSCPDHDDRLDGGTVEAPDEDEGIGRICCRCGRFFMIFKSRLGWDLEPSTVIMDATRNATVPRIGVRVWLSFGLASVRFVYR